MPLPIKDNLTLGVSLVRLLCQAVVVAHKFHGASQPLTEDVVLGCVSVMLIPLSMAWTQVMNRQFPPCGWQRSRNKLWLESSPSWPAVAVDVAPRPDCCFGRRASSQQDF